MCEVVLVQSVCNIVENPWSYSKIRSIFNKKERFSQLIQTIFSIKKYLPNAFIVLIECSNLTNSQEKVLNSYCNIFRNFIKDENIRKRVQSQYKGSGERILQIVGIETIFENIPNVFRIWKISGRYQLSQSFSINNFSESLFNFYAINGNKKNVNTCVLVIPRRYIKVYIDYLKSTEKELIEFHQGSYETYIGVFAYINSEKINWLDKVGVYGQVGVCGSNFNI